MQKSPADKPEKKYILTGNTAAEIERKKSRFIATAAEVHSEAEALEFIEKIRKKYWDARHNCYAFITTDSAIKNNSSRNFNSGIKSTANAVKIPQQGRDFPGDLLRIIQRFSDDGEPSGTAGRPILDVLSGRDMLNTCIVVTRYFGGTLLGTGGLIRAYTDASAAVLDKANTSISANTAGVPDKANTSISANTAGDTSKNSNNAGNAERSCGIYELKSGFEAILTCEYYQLGKIQYALAQNEIPVISSEFGERPSMEIIIPEGTAASFSAKLADITAGSCALKIGYSVFYIDTASGSEIYIP